MQELSQKTKDLLRGFMKSPYYDAYKEYVTLEAGKCLGQLRIMSDDPAKDTYIKGQMFGLEKFILDLFQDTSITNLEKANHLNREYTKEVLDKSMDGMLSRE